MPDADTDFRRLAARGDFRIQPALRWDDAPPEVRDGHVWQVSVSSPCVGLVWWPQGQTGNPFCRRSFLGATVAEVLARAVEATRPPWHSLESLVSHYLYEREREKVH